THHSPLPTPLRPPQTTPPPHPPPPGRSRTHPHPPPIRPLSHRGSKRTPPTRTRPRHHRINQLRRLGRQPNPTRRQPLRTWHHRHHQHAHRPQALTTSPKNRLGRCYRPCGGPPDPRVARSMTKAKCHPPSS